MKLTKYGNSKLHKQQYLGTSFVCVKCKAEFRIVSKQDPAYSNMRSYTPTEGLHFNGVCDWCEQATTFYEKGYEYAPTLRQWLSRRIRSLWT